MEVIIKFFLMRTAYDTPELKIPPEACFNEEEQNCLEHQILNIEGKTQKLKNPYPEKDLKRYVWCIARMGGGKDMLQSENLVLLHYGLVYRSLKC